VQTGLYIVGQGLGMEYHSQFSRTTTVLALPTLTYEDTRRAAIAHIYDAYDSRVSPVRSEDPHMRHRSRASVNPYLLL